MMCSSSLNERSSKWNASISVLFNWVFVDSLAILLASRIHPEMRKGRWWSRGSNHGWIWPSSNCGFVTEKGRRMHYTVKRSISFVRECPWLQTTSCKYSKQSIRVCEYHCNSPPPLPLHYLHPLPWHPRRTLDNGLYEETQQHVQPNDLPPFPRNASFYARICWNRPR